MLLLLLALIWTPTAGQYTLSARPTSANTEALCFYEVDAADTVLSDFGCSPVDAACLGDLPNCRIEHTITVPADGVDRLVKARAKRTVAGQDLFSGLGGTVVDGSAGVVVALPQDPFLVE